MRTEFWAVIAQTVPVIALALVIEARAFARQVRTKRAFIEHRRERIYFAASTTVVAGLLLVTLALSLGALHAVTPYPVAFSYIAMFFISVSFGAVVINPLVALLPALTSDVRAERKLAAARRKTGAALVMVRRATAWAEGIMRDRNIVQLTDFADKYTRAMALARKLARESDAVSLEKLRAANAYIAELESWRGTYSAQRAEGLALIAEGHRLIREGERSDEPLDIQPYLRALRRIIA